MSNLELIGTYKHIKCPKCEWQGFVGDLLKDFVCDEEENILDEHWVCPNCKTIIIE
jgi:DNA-directed RNA polymerase subunit RPC12/RpoP